MAIDPEISEWGNPSGRDAGYPLMVGANAGN